MPPHSYLLSELHIIRHCVTLFFVSNADMGSELIRLLELIRSNKFLQTNLIDLKIEGAFILCIMCGPIASLSPNRIYVVVGGTFNRMVKYRQDQVIKQASGYSRSFAS